MIDLDIAEFSLGVAESSGDKSVPVNCAMMRELITRLRQAEKEAARYRHLRLELEQSQGSLALFCGDSYVCDLDAFLDEEMQYNGDGK